MPMPTTTTSALALAAAEPEPGPRDRLVGGARAVAAALVQVVLLGGLFTLYKWFRFLGRERHDLSLIHI